MLSQVDIKSQISSFLQWYLTKCMPVDNLVIGVRALERVFRGQSDRLKFRKHIQVN